MAERTRLPLHLGPQSVAAFAGLGIGWPHPGLSDLQTHHDSFWAHGLQELSVCLHLLLPAPRQGRPSGNNAGRTAWLAQSPQLGSKSQASCEPIPGHRSSGRGGSGDSQHRGPRGTCPAPSHPTPHPTSSKGISSPAHCCLPQGSLALFKGGHRHSCMAAGTSTSLSQGSQPAVSSSGCVPVHLAPGSFCWAFAGLKSTHGLKSSLLVQVGGVSHGNAKPLHGLPARSRSFNLTCTSSHYGATTGTFPHPTGAGQEVLVTDT